MKLRLLVLALVATLFSIVPVSPASAATTLTFPDVTMINPTIDPYVVEVADPPSDGYFEYFVKQVRGTAPIGTTIEIPLTTSGRVSVIVRHCPESGQCVEIGRSAMFQVFVDLPFASGSRTLGAGPQEARIKLGLPDVVVDVDWELRADGVDDAVSAGSERLTFGSDGYATMSFTVPTDLPDGALYGLVLRGQLDHPELGHLEADGVVALYTIDSDPPGVYLRTSTGRLAPERDGYLDTVKITAGVIERGFDVSLAVVKGDRTVHTFAGRKVTWNGSVGGKPLAPGTYAVRFAATDEFGNRAVIDKPLKIVGDRLVIRTTTRTYTAAGSEVDRLVQACSRLASPSSHRWAGSLGYYSQTSCRRPQQSAVLTLHAADLPPAYDERYLGLRVSVYGGSSRGHSGSYIVLGYLGENNGESVFVKRAQFDGRLGWHRGLVGSGNLVRENRPRPYFLWQLGLSEGSHYDVKGFRLQITYRVLVRG